AHDLVAKADALGERLQEECRSLINHPLVGDVRGAGLMAGIEIVADKGSRASFPRARRVAERVAASAFARGVWLLAGVGGQADGRGDMLVLGPPLVATPDDLRLAVDVIAAALDEARGALAD
ncbi:MAG: aspartate aminotransferase family protein, partial [Alphaproteobacteria bacterium]|nr:aspartate aminotransferase family protein [Alphaproteobacteria bacterium]